MKKILILLLAVALFACNSQPKAEEAATEESVSHAAEWVEVTLDVEGMTCDGCEKAINAGVESLEGIAEVESDWEAKFTKVKFDKSVTSLEEISDKITETGYTVKGEL
jgi:copper chaperone CopZ